MPDIFRYIDFREYLRDYYNEQKEVNNQFSYRWFATKVGVKAPNFLQWIIEGKRKLAEGKVPVFCSILNLSEKESQYFSDMVHFIQSKSLGDKDFYFRSLLELRKPSPASNLTQAQYEHYSKWYNEAIRILLTYIDFKPDGELSYRKLGRMISPSISGGQAHKALDQMLHLNMIHTDKDGFLRTTEEITTTGDEVRSFFIKRFHESMITLAAESIDRFPSHVREISGITMSISDESFEIIKKEIQQTRKRILETVEMDKKSDTVYQFNVQLFPLVPRK